MSAPRGPDQVRAALVAAATDLFATWGPSAVSVRRIADAAGVNHGLVHHYFGSKDGLLVAVLEELSRRSEEEVVAGEYSAEVFTAGGASERQARIVAHLLLQGVDPADFKSDFPGIRALIKRFRDEGLGVREARQRAAQVVSLVLGWSLFEPFVTAATGLDRAPEDGQWLLLDAMGRLLREP